MYSIYVQELREKQRVPAGNSALKNADLTKEIYGKSSDELAERARVRRVKWLEAEAEKMKASILEKERIEKQSSVYEPRAPVRGADNHFMGSNLEVLPRACYKGGGLIDQSKSKRMQSVLTKLGRNKQTPRLVKGPYDDRPHEFRTRDKTKWVGGDDFHFPTIQPNNPQFSNFECRTPEHPFKKVSHKGALHNHYFKVPLYCDILRPKTSDLAFFRENFEVAKERRKMKSKRSKPRSVDVRNDKRPWTAGNCTSKSYCQSVFELKK